MASVETEGSSLDVLAKVYEERSACRDWTARWAREYLNRLLVDSDHNSSNSNHPYRRGLDFTEYEHLRLVEYVSVSRNVNFAIVYAEPCS